MGTINCERDPLSILEEALQAGITMFQLREKGKHALQKEAYVQFARQCQSLCQSYGVTFIVNDDVELALQLDADGIHVGQDDIKIETFRQRASNKIIGVSVHTMEQLTQAIEKGADYVGVGPIFETMSKEDAKSPVGLSLIEEARSKFPHFPIVAIGGITSMTSHTVRLAGANGIAVISEICLSDDISETVSAL